MHGLAEYGLMHVKLYEDIARYGHVATTYDYPVMVDGRNMYDPEVMRRHGFVYRGVGRGYADA